MINFLPFFGVNTTFHTYAHCLLLELRTSKCEWTVSVGAMIHPKGTRLPLEHHEIDTCLLCSYSQVLTSYNTVILHYPW
jgi:hypothetical protein